MAIEVKHEPMNVYRMVEFLASDADTSKEIQIVVPNRMAITINRPTHIGADSRVIRVERQTPYATSVWTCSDIDVSIESRNNGRNFKMALIMFDKANIITGYMIADFDASAEWTTTIQSFD